MNVNINILRRENLLDVTVSTHIMHNMFVVNTGFFILQQESKPKFNIVNKAVCDISVHIEDHFEILLAAIPLSFM